MDARQLMVAICLQQLWQMYMQDNPQDMVAFDSQVHRAIFMQKAIQTAFAMPVVH